MLPKNHLMPGDYPFDLRRLSFVDNFDCFEREITIPAGTEVEIRNGFKDGAIPTRWFVVDIVGDGHVRRGDASWTRDLLYLKESGGVDDVTVTVIFY